MAMQVAPEPLTPLRLPTAWPSLRPDLLERWAVTFRRGEGTAEGDSWNIPELLARHELLDHTLAPTPAALLLFGTEQALKEAYPFFRTRLSRRDLDRHRETLQDLPCNLIDQMDALQQFVQNEVPERDYVQDVVSGTGRHASTRNAAILPWFFEMAVSRDYSQVKIARFVRDRDYVFLEYPRNVIRSDSLELSVTRYQTNPVLAAALGRLYPTMQVWVAPAPDSETQDSPLARSLARERAYFDFAPLRIDGRFYKVMATLPQKREQQTHEAPSSPLPQDSAMQAASTPASSTVPAPSPNPSSPEANPGLPHPASSTTPSLHSASPALRTAPPDNPSVHPVHPVPAPPVRPVRSQAPDRTARILEFCRTPRQREEIQKFVGMNNRDHFRKDVLNRLIAQGLITPTLPDKPNSPRQRYVSVLSEGSTSAEAAGIPEARPSVALTAMQAAC